MLVLVADRADPNRGGRERYAADLAAFLSSGGCDVRILSPAELRADRGHAQPVLAFSPTRHATHYQFHGGLLSDAFAAERESMTSRMRRALFRPALALNRRRQRLLAEEAAMLERPIALMAFSASIARELIERRGVPADRVMISRPGVDLARFRPSLADARACSRASGGGSRPLALAFVGHNFALKGLRAAILAVASARRDGLDVGLTVAGRGAIARYARLADRRGLGAHVRFVGPLTQDEVAALYRASDALLHPTFFDPFPRAVVEALASGCPVLTTARCGAAEILTDGADGFVIRDPRDVRALSDAVCSLADPARLTEMRANAVRRGRQFDAAVHFREAVEWLSAPTPER